MLLKGLMTFKTLKPAISTLLWENKVYVADATTIKSIILEPFLRYVPFSNKTSMPITFSTSSEMKIKVNILSQNP